MVKKLFLNGRYFATIKYSKDLYSNYKKHMHPTLSFGIVEDGTLLVEFNSFNIKLTKDKVVAFNQFELHRSKNIDAKGYYSIYINQEWLDSKLKSRVSCNNIVEYKGISAIVKDAYNSAKSDNLATAIEAIISSFCTKAEYKNSKVVDTVLDYIYTNIKYKISIDTIAKELAYSKEYLIRTFKSQMGMTPGQFIVALKLDMSSQLLLSSSCSVVDVSSEFSFFDQSHYIKTFKSIYGVSPKSYKKSIFYN